MSKSFSIAELTAYLDEALSNERLSAIEQALRDDPKLVQQLAKLIRQRDSGVHSVAEIWRRGRLTCPDRNVLGQMLLGLLDDDYTSYVEFHIREVGCRYCAANLHDLEQQREESATQVNNRRQKYYASSAGYLRSRK